MERSSENQGELSLIEIVEGLNKLDGRRTPEPSSSASIAIALDEEKNRRQECEKVIQQLYTEVSELKQENAVAKAGIQRKDSLLMQAQQQWKTLKIDWEQRLELVKDEKDRLNTTVTRLEGQLQISIAESRKSSAELQTVTRLKDEMFHNLQEENSRLKEKYEQSQSQLREIMVEFDDNKKELKRNEIKMDELKRDNHKLKGQIEDLKREKNKLIAELELLQQQFESNQEQNEAFCLVRIQEATQNAEEEANRRLQIWQHEVDSKMSHLIATLEQQLGILKAKSLAESQAKETRHQEEVQKLRQEIKNQKKEYHDLTRKMRELAQAQWNTVNRIPSSGTRQTASSFVSSEISDATLPVTNGTNQEEFFNFHIKRHDASPTSKDPNEPAPRRKK